MKRLSVLLLLITSQLSFAIGWNAVDSDVDSATSTKGIAAILTQYPEIQASHNYEAKDMTQLTVSIISLEYAGDNTCQQDDPRLKYKHFSYFFCLKGSAHNCVDYYDDFKEDTDPCAAL